MKKLDVEDNPGEMFSEEQQNKRLLQKEINQLNNKGESLFSLLFSKYL